MTRLTGRLPLLLLSGLVCQLHAAEAVSNTPQIYSCVDAQGRKLTSDRPIRECLDREQKILNPSGTVKQKIGPVLTAQERAELEARNRAEQVERALQEEEKRRNRALLTRYPTPDSHQKERVEALEHIARVKQSAASRAAQLQLDLTKLMDEMEFYKKDPTKAPVKLRRQIEEVNQALASQDRFMAEQDSETKRVKDRFDEELNRLKPLWRNTLPKAL
ncbi:MAG TPA: DUF4124 domain-containing protein [Rhodoferax sp.]|nr:DUF4124 domain-containing protein [Rhodoferax sp.]